MFAYSYSSALRDFLLRPARIVVWLSVALIVFGIGKFWVYMTGGDQLEASYGQFAVILIYRLIALAAAIFGTMVISQEIEQKTIVYQLTRVLPRRDMLWSRTLAAVTAVSIVSIVCTISAVLSTLGPAGLGQGMVWRDMLIAVVGATSYTALFVVFSLLLNRAMIFCILFAFGWESFVPNMPGEMYYVSIATYLKGLAIHPAEQQLGGVARLLSGTVLPKDPVSPIACWIVLAVIIGGCLAFGAWWFGKFEYSPREDAE